MNSSRPYPDSLSSIYSMEFVIQLLQQNRNREAIGHMMRVFDCGNVTAGEAVEDLRPYLDPSHPEYPKASQKAPEAIPEPCQVGEPSPGIVLENALRNTTKLPLSETKPEDLRGLPEPIQEKPTINKWIVTGYSPKKKDYWNHYITAKSAEESAQILCEEGFTHVRISQVIAEAKTTYTISL